MATYTYTPTTTFAGKDSLPTNDPAKKLRGFEFDTEFDALKVAIDPKYDVGSLADQPTAQAGTNNTTLMTPLRTQEHQETWAAENAGAIEDIQALTDPGADRILFWDSTATAGVEWLTVSTGLLITGNALTVQENAINHDALQNFVSNEHIDHTSVSVSAGTGMSGGGTIAATRTLNFNPASLSTIGGASLSYTADAVVIDDGGTPKRVTINDFVPKVISTASAKTLADGEQNCTICLTGSTDRTFTINSTFNSACETGTMVTFVNVDTGAITVAGSGITLTSKNSATTLSAQGSTAVAIKVNSSEWVLSGDLI